MSEEITPLATRADIDADLAVADYVAGRMAPANRADFERRLAQEPELAAAVAEERDLHAALTPAPHAGVPAAAAFERLRDTLEPPQSRRQAPFLAAAVVAVLAVSVLVLRPTEPKPVFEGLSDPTTQTTEAGDVRIVFAPGTDAATRSRIAETLGFELVSGPGPGGAFVVRPVDRVAPAELRDWRQHADIVLAEPIISRP
ncbi:MAG: hypothetical protein AAFS02_14095 [Pseudomonadota bacterium]